MYTEIQIRIKPEQAGVEETLRQIAARVAGVGTERICRVDIVRKSIDARQKEVMFNLVAGLHIDRIEEKEKVFVPAYRDVFKLSVFLIYDRGYCKKRSDGSGCGGPGSQTGSRSQR